MMRKNCPTKNVCVCEGGGGLEAGGTRPEEPERKRRIGRLPMWPVCNPGTVAAWEKNAKSGTPPHRLRMWFPSLYEEMGLPDGEDA